MKKELSELFNSIYFHKYSFEELIKLDPLKESTKIIINRREVYQPNKKLKAIHLFIRLFVLQYLPVSQFTFSFKESLNPSDALYCHRNNNYFFITDFRNFFNSLTSSDFETVLMQNRSLIPLKNFTKYLPDILNLTTINDCLPIGFSTSPDISNIILHSFDKKINELCSQKEIVFTRYADDLIFSAKDKSPLEHIPQFIQDTSLNLFNNRLQINYKKNRYLARRHKIKIMNSIILPNGEITLDKQVKRNIESALYTYLNKNDEWQEFLQNKYPGGIEQLSGVIGYANSIDKKYINKLRRKYGILTVDLFLKKKI